MTLLRTHTPTLCSSTSRTLRQEACKLVKMLWASDAAVKQAFGGLFIDYLGDVSSAGEAAAEFVELYHELVQDEEMKLFLVCLLGCVP